MLMLITYDISFDDPNGQARLRRIALNTTHHVQLRRALQQPQRNIQRIDRTLNRRILAIIANLPLKHPLTRLNLRRDDIARNQHGILL